MKKILNSVLISLMALMVSCYPENFPTLEGESISKTDIIGEWKSENGEYYVFKEDKFNWYFKENDKDNFQRGKWDINLNKNVKKHEDMEFSEIEFYIEDMIVNGIDTYNKSEPYLTFFALKDYDKDSQKLHIINCDTFNEYIIEKVK